jgi:hypothetical protein
MVPASLTAEQAGDLIAQLRAVLAGHGQFLDIVMPNGRRTRARDTRGNGWPAPSLDQGRRPRHCRRARGARPR